MNKKLLQKLLHSKKVKSVVYSMLVFQSFGYFGYNLAALDLNKSYTELNKSGNSAQTANSITSKIADFKLSYVPMRVVVERKKIEKDIAYWYYLKAIGLGSGALLAGVGTYWWHQSSQAQQAREQAALEGVRRLGDNFTQAALNRLNSSNTREDSQQPVDAPQQQNVQSVPNVPNIQNVAQGSPSLRDRISNNATWVFSGTKDLVARSTKSAVQWWIGYNALSLVKGALPNTGKFLKNITATYNIDWYIDNYTDLRHTFKNNVSKSSDSSDPFANAVVAVYKFIDGKDQDPINCFSKLHDSLMSYFKSSDNHKDIHLYKSYVLAQQTICALEKINAYILYRSSFIYKKSTESSASLDYKLKFEEAKMMIKNIQVIAERLISLLSELQLKSSLGLSYFKEQLMTIEFDALREIGHFRDLEFKL